jgi:hypothetical protein
MIETVFYLFLIAQIPLAVLVFLTILLPARWVFGIIGAGAIGLGYVWVKHVIAFGAPLHRHASGGEELFFLGVTIIAIAVGLYTVGFLWMRSRIKDREQGP